MVPKKVLLLVISEKDGSFAGTGREDRLLAYCKRLEAATENTQFFVASINELLIRIATGEVSMYDTRNKQDLRTYQLVHGFNMSFVRDHFQAVNIYLQHHGIPMINKGDVQGTPFGKISQMVLFALHNIAVPDTLAVWDGALYERAVQDSFTLPLILKINQGSKGNNNFLVESWEQFSRLLRAHGAEGYIVQPYIPNDGDYRVLYMGNERMVLYRQAQNGSHLNNTSQGGAGRLLDAADYPAIVRDIAVRAMRVYSREVGGVDVLVDKHTNVPYVLEVNNTPAILSGMFLEEKSLHYARFIDGLLKGKRP